MTDTPTAPNSSDLGPRLGPDEVPATQAPPVGPDVAAQHWDPRLWHRA